MFTRSNETFAVIIKKYINDFKNHDFKMFYVYYNISFILDNILMIQNEKYVIFLIEILKSFQFQFFICPGSVALIPNPLITTLMSVMRKITTTMTSFRISAVL